MQQKQDGSSETGLNGHSTSVKGVSPLPIQEAAERHHGKAIEPLKSREITSRRNKKKQGEPLNRRTAKDAKSFFQSG